MINLISVLNKNDLIMKHIQLFKNIIYSTLFVTVFLLNSCTNDEGYDIKGDPINRVYVTTPDENVFNFNVEISPVSANGNVKAKFAARSTQFASSDLKVTFEIDNSLIENYNTKSTIKYNPVPSELLTILNKELTISKGKIVSTDSISVGINNEKFSLLTKENYLLPIKISSLSQSKNLAISTNQSIVYIKINVLHLNVYDSPKTEAMVGTFISDRSGWVVTNFQSTSDLFFDGDNATSGKGFDNSDGTLNVDLGKIYNNISGIKLTSYYDVVYGVPAADVYTSTDGITWKSQGLAKMNESGNIKFYENIQSVRYVRLDLKSDGNYYYITEFDLYQN